MWAVIYMRTVKSDSSGNPQVFNIPAATITRGGTGNKTATFTSTIDHELATGDTVSVRGVISSSTSVPQAECYNGNFTVTVSSARVFTYTMLADPGANVDGDSDDGDIIARKQLDSEEYSPFVLVDPFGRMVAHEPCGEVYFNPGGTPLDQAVIRAEPAKLLTLEVYNTDASVNLYCLLVNKATAPVNTDVGICTIKVLADNQNYFGPYRGGLSFSAGIAVAMSTTPGVVTLPTTNKGLFTARHIK